MGGEQKLKLRHCWDTYHTRENGGGEAARTDLDGVLDGHEDVDSLVLVEQVVLQDGVHFLQFASERRVGRLDRRRQTVRVVPDLLRRTL